MIIKEFLAIGGELMSKKKSNMQSNLIYYLVWIVKKVGGWDRVP